MVQANQLRIGNWILTKDVGAVQAETLYFLGSVGADGAVYEPEDIEGIPLTPEILEACGFQNTQEDVYPVWTRSNTRSYFPLFNSDEGAGYNFYHQDISTPLTCLHQLQNLYFSLTGEELEVNLKEPINS